MTLKKRYLEEVAQSPTLIE